MDIKLDTVGYIKSGTNAGKYMKIMHYEEGSEDYTILTSDNIDMINCFDDWVIDFDTLMYWFEAHQWIVDWDVSVK